MTEKTNLFPSLIRFRETNRLKMAIAASMLPRLKALNVEFLTGWKLASVGKNTITLEPAAGGTQIEKPAEQVVMSVGVRSDNALYEEIKDCFERAFLIGDAKQIGRIAQATHGAYNLARKLK